ncbi:MAG TPA: Holliday junction branch migration protein RuvA [Pirellulaceae bacterium]|nr:Holliday junction branch migration protein RuvA [Pirellulaceae bacterium]
MITKITGQLAVVGEDRLTLVIDAFEYEVLIPDLVRRALSGRVGEKISLHTMEYIEGNSTQSKLTPRLVGFLNTIEREFFDMFCSVDGVGVKKALRAMGRPVQDIAQLIENQDTTGLSSLPGIGAAMAERIIAKLRRKMSKFALLVAQPTYEAEVERDVVQDTFEILRTLGHNEVDARKLLDSVLATKKKFKDVDALLNAVYQQSHA